MESKKAYKKLLEKNGNKFFRLTEYFRHGVVWISENGQIIHANQQFITDLGYEKDSFTANTIFEVNPYFNLMSWRDKWRELTEKGELEMETQHISADGIIHPVRMKSLLFDMEGKWMCCGIIQETHRDNRMRHLLEMTASITHAGSWQYDMVKNSWIFTDEILKILNIDPAERGKRSLTALLRDFMNPKEHKTLVRKLDAAKETGETFSMEFGVPTHIQNKHKYVRLTAIPEQQNGETLSLYGVVQDISEINERTAELYLAKHSIDYGHEPMSWLDKEGNIVYLNRAYKKLTGYLEEDNPKLKIYDVNKTLDAAGWKQMWEGMKADKKVVIETLHTTRKGEAIPVEVYANHLTFEGEEYLCTFLRDTRVRKKKTQPQRLAQFALEHNPLTCYWIDKSGQLIYANEAASQLTGYSRKDLLKKNIMELTDSYPDVRMWNARWRIMQEAGSGIYEATLITKEKEIYPVEVTRNYISHEGKEFICVFIKDISDRKKREEEIKETLAATVVQSTDLSKEVAVLRQEMDTGSSLNSIITNSEKYLHVLGQVQRVSETSATVLITGETGTGKELLAKAVHELSERSDKQLIKVNAAVIPENLFESELFGHEKGSFTGAVQTRIGRFEAANNGTIFLDEIGEMPLDLQAKLLRVLQEGEFERVGGNKTFKVDVRVVAATNRNLEDMVNAGTFREDLYYRLNVFPIHNLPLRERKEDIPLLVDFFLKKYGRKLGKKIKEVPVAGLKKLMKYEFPGNVRELENMVERAIILSSSNYLNLDAVVKSEKLKKTRRSGVFQTLDELQREYIITAIKRCNGRISGASGAAVILGLNDKTLYSRIKKLGIEKAEYV